MMGTHIFRLYNVQKFAHVVQTLIFILNFCLGELDKLIAIAISLHLLFF
jgi:hypothetical protein